MTRTTTRRTRHRLALALRWVAFACVLGLLAACASMPSGGGVREVSPDDATGTEADEQQVRVFGVPPQPNESPRDLVDGFLEALTSDEPEYQTARQYLTPEASKNWRPEAGIKIVDKTPNATVAGFPAPKRPRPSSPSTASRSAASTTSSRTSRGPSPSRPTASSSRSSRTRTASGASRSCRTA